MQKKQKMHKNKHYVKMFPLPLQKKHTQSFIHSFNKQIKQITNNNKKKKVRKKQIKPKKRKKVNNKKIEKQKHIGKKINIIKRHFLCGVSFYFAIILFVCLDVIQSKLTLSYLTTSYSNININTNTIFYKIVLHCALQTKLG